MPPRHRSSRRRHDSDSDSVALPATPSSLDAAKGHADAASLDSGEESRDRRSQFETADENDDWPTRMPIDDVNFGQASKYAAKRNEMSNSARRSRGADVEQRKKRSRPSDERTSADTRARSGAYHQRSPIYSSQYPEELPFRGATGHQGLPWQHDPPEKSSYAVRPKIKDHAEGSRERRGVYSHGSPLEDEHLATHSAGSPTADRSMGSGGPKRSGSRSRSPSLSGERRRSRSPGEMSSSSEDSAHSRPRGGPARPEEAPVWEGGLPRSRSSQRPYSPLSLEGHRPGAPKRLPKPPHLPPLPGRELPRIPRHHQDSYSGPPRPVQPLPAPPSARELSPMIRTRAGQRRSEEDNAPIAKRLRR